MTTSSTIKNLRTLRSHSESLWNTAVNTAGLVDCGERYDARREQVAAEARDSALACWDAAIAAVESGALARALDELEAASQLAAAWGDSSPELKALALLEALREAATA